MILNCLSLFGTHQRLKKHASSESHQFPFLLSKMAIRKTNGTICILSPFIPYKLHYLRSVRIDFNRQRALDYLEN